VIFLAKLVEERMTKTYIYSVNNRERPGRMVDGWMVTGGNTIRFRDFFPGRPGGISPRLLRRLNCSSVFPGKISEVVSEIHMFLLLLHGRMTKLTAGRVLRGPSGILESKTKPVSKTLIQLSCRLSAREVSQIHTKKYQAVAEREDEGAGRIPWFRLRLNKCDV
jgi:hypothetical protein